MPAQVFLLKLYVELQLNLWLRRCIKFNAKVLIERYFMVIFLFKKLCFIATISYVNKIV